MARDAFAAAADLLDPPITGAAAYRDHPEKFVLECFHWEKGDGPTPYQLRNLREMVKHKRVAIRGCHGLGKSCTNAWALLWFALTRDARGEDWKAVTTASAWRQLTEYLWPEIHKWSGKLNWAKLGRGPFTPRELMQLKLQLRFGHAFAAACEDPAKIEGCHADEVLFIFDEAKTIPPATFDAAEGAFSGAGGDTKQEAYVIASSTPGPPLGRFYEIHKGKSGLEDWHRIHVKLEETIQAKRNSKEWVDKRRRQWGSTSAVFRTRVLGEFAEDETDGIIPLSWVEAAIERGYHLPDIDPNTESLTVGADVARSGDAKTVIALRYNHAIREIRGYSAEGTMETAGRVHGVMEAYHHPARQSTAVVDVVGIGAGVVDRLRETSLERIVPFGASERSERRDRSGELGFVNKRSAAWWNLREMLDPDADMQVAICVEGADIGDISILDHVVGDLTAPRWKVMSGGKVQVESKDDIKKRINRSTDVGDAIVMAFWPASGILSSLDHFAENPDFGFFASAPQRSRWHI